MKTFATGARRAVVALLLLTSTLIAGLSFAGSSSATANSALGVYVTTPAAIAPINALLGFRVSQALAFVPASSWTTISDPAPTLQLWDHAGYKMTWAVPMLPTGHVSSLGQPDPDGLREGASGAYDSQFESLATRLVAAGQAHSTIDLGWDFNTAWVPWSATENASDYVSYYRHIVTAMRSVKGAAFQFEWAASQTSDGVNLAAAYPGDGYVTDVGLDVFNEANGHRFPGDRSEWRSILGKRSGLSWLASFGASHHKALALPEWGLSSGHRGTHSGADDSAFVQHMASWLGTHEVVSAISWDVGPDALPSAQAPSAESQFASSFSRNPGRHHPSTTTTTTSTTTTTTSTTTTTTTTTMPSGSMWIPTSNNVWQWDLAGTATVDPVPCYPSDGSVIPDCPVHSGTEPNFVDFDPLNAQQGSCAAGQAGASCDEAAAASAISQYHALGVKVVCYVDVGTAEDWRLDVGANFATLISNLQSAGLTESDLLGSTNGWPGERWLNTNPTGPAYGFLQNMMKARFELAKQAGCNGIEPDNLDVSENSGTGVSETVAQGDQYAEWVAKTVHSLGMSVAQKNFEDQSSVLEPYFDFVIEEQCYQYSDCSDLQPYISAGKAVFDVEYPSGSISASDCPSKGLVKGVNVMLKDMNVDPSPRVVCS